MIKAENDLLNIRNNLAAETVPRDTVCFHAQQAAEKMLKARIVPRGRRPKRIHDLLALLSECILMDPTLSELEDDCRELTEYGVVARYPRANYESDEAEARAMVERAERIHSAIKSRLPQ